MANLSGGETDKLGNQYEKWVVIRKYIDILAGKLDSVTVESLQYNESADIICKKDSTIYAYQCKVRNGHNDAWDIARLKPILLKAKNDLLKGNHFDRFILISPIPETNITDTARDLRQKGKEAFYEKAICKINKRNEEFDKIRSYLSSNSSEEQDTQFTLDLLSRFEYHFMGNDPETKKTLVLFLKIFLNGNASNAFSALYEFIDEHLGEEINYDVLSNFLKSGNFTFREEVSDNDKELIQYLAECYVTGYEDRLIDKTTFKRPYTEAILNLLKNGKDVLLTGSAGVGKSGTVLDLINTLKGENLVLPINVNDRNIGDDPIQMARNLNFASRLDYVLHDIKTDRPIIIIIDQLDTVKMLNSGKISAYNTIKQFMKDIKTIRQYGINIQIVITCRNFDLENDQNLETLTEDFEKIDIKPLSEEEVTEILQPKGIKYNSLPKQTQKLINTFFNLKLFLKVYDRSEPRLYTTKLKLMGAFINKIRETMPEITSILNGFANALIENNDTKRHKDRVECTEQEINILKSAGVFTQRDDFISFEHQGFLDYFSSLDLSTKLEEDIGNIHTWLGNKEEQTLRKAVIFSNALQMVTDDYILNLSKAILPSQNIRYHIKHTLLSFLSTKEAPEPRLEECIYQLAINPDYQSIIFNRVFYQDNYISKLIDSGKLYELLSNGNSIALNVIRNTLRRADQYTDFILSYVFPNKKEAIYEHYHYGLDKMPIAIMDAYIENAPESYAINEYMHIGGTDDLIKICTLCAKVLEKTIFSPIETNYIHNTIDNKDFKFPLKLEFHTIPSDSIEKALCNTDIESLKSCFEILISPMTRLFSTLPKDKLLNINIGNEEMRGKSITENSYFLLRHIGRHIINQDEDFIMNKFKAVCDELHPYIKILFFEILEEVRNPENADFIIGWITDNKLAYDDIHSIVIRNYYHFTGQLIEKISPICSSKMLQAFQEMVISTKPYLYYKVVCNNEKEDYLKTYDGEAQFLLLSKIPKRRLVKDAKEMLNIATLGYGLHTHFYQQVDFKVRSVVSPLHEKSVTAEKWLSVITDMNLTYEDRWSEREQDSKHYYEHSIRAYSSDFQNAVIKNPNRFLKLALDNLGQIRTEFIESIFSALEQYSNRDVKKKINYKLMKTFIIKYFDIYNYSICKSMCNILEHRYDGKLPICFVYSLPEIAMQNLGRSIEIDNTSLDHDEAPVLSIEHASCNTARGEAYHTMSSLLFKDYELFRIFKPAMVQGLTDLQPAVRMAVMSCVYSTYNIDKELSFEMFKELIKEDYKPALGSYGTKYINITVEKHSEVFRDIFNRILIAGKDKEILNIAYGTVAYHVYYGCFQDLVEKCLYHSAQTRKGLKKGVYQCISDYYDKAVIWLEKLLKHPDTEDDEIGYMQLKNLSPNQLKDFLAKMGNGTIPIHILPYVIDAMKRDGLDWSCCMDEIQRCIIEYLGDQKQKKQTLAVNQFYDAITTYIKEMSDYYTSHNQKDKISSILDIWDEMLKQQNRTYTDMHNKLMLEMN